MKKLKMLFACLVITISALADNRELKIDMPNGNVPDVVDLGLTSGTLWASCNLGAASPEDYGYYFAWGETKPKSNYDWSTYKYGGKSNFSKYNYSDGLTELELEDDAAYAILGKGWRMPTHDEELELVNECLWESVTVNGISGYKITGPNGSSIFLPRGGLYDGTDYGSNGTTLSNVNSCGWYWSSTLNERGSSYAQGLCFFPSLLTNVADHERCDGHNIRPVYVGKNDIADVVDLGLSIKWASWNVGADKPEGLGNLYAWGELTPKDDYSTSTYKFYDGGYTKYGSVDEKYRLDNEDDVAQQMWGDKWRIPTFEELQELHDNCTFTPTELNGVPVTKVTGPNGNFIYFPYPGNYTGSNLYFDNSVGSYWSCDLQSDYYAKDLDFSRGYQSLNGDYRYHGQSIRPVYVGEEFDEMIVSTLIFDATSQPMLVGGYINNYSEQNVKKKGIIVSKNLDDMFITENTKYYKAEVIGSDLYEGVSWENFDVSSFDIRFIDCTGTNEEQYAYALQFLMGDTDYYVKAFVIDTEDKVIYGNAEKLHTQNYNRYQGAHDYANVWKAFDYTLFDLVTDEIINPNEGFYYSTNENPTNVRFQTGTGYNTCYKYLTEWNYRLWYYQQWNRDKYSANNYSRTHVPMMKYSDGKLDIEKNPLDTDKDITIYYSVDGNYFRPEYYTSIYEQPLELTEPCTVYCYAISSNGSISYTNLYRIGEAASNDSVVNHEAAIAALRALLDRAQALYDNSTEGENNGEYAAGSRAELLAVINSVNARISSTMSYEDITQCTNEINAAIELFESKKVTAGEDTDISQLANTIYLERVEAAPGNQLTLSVKMKNAVTAESFGFDLYLPDGVTVAIDEEGFPMASLSTQRTTANKTNIFNADFNQDGALNILAYSTRGYTINGNDGEVALITINIASSVEAGEYPIIIRNIAIADENSVTYRVDNVKSTLVISAYTLGDANGDCYIDVGDLTAISHYILERPDATFNAKAADANNDNNIDVGDLTAVSHIILWGSVQRPSEARQTGKTQTEPRQQSNNVTDVSTLDNVIYVEPFTVAANSTYTMSVKMKNAVIAEGFGFDLVLPVGLTVATDEDGFPLATLSTERTTVRKTTFNADFKVDGTLNIQAYSPNGSPISGNDGEVAQILLNIAADVDPDTYPIYIRNIAISDVNATSHRTDEVETAVTVTAAGATSINSLTPTPSPKSEGTIFDLQGRRVEHPAKGLYIRNGKKEVVK